MNCFFHTFLFQQSYPLSEGVVTLEKDRTAELVFDINTNDIPIVRPFLEFDQPLWVRDELALKDVTIKLGNIKDEDFKNPVDRDYFLRIQLEVYGCEVDDMIKQMKVSDQCPVGWTASSLHCYKLFNVTDNIDFIGANNLCKNHGGELIMPRNEEEEKAVVEMMIKNEAENITGFLGENTLNHIILCPPI